MLKLCRFYIKWIQIKILAYEPNTRILILLPTLRKTQLKQLDHNGWYNHPTVYTTIINSNTHIVKISIHKTDQTQFI